MTQIKIKTKREMCINLCISKSKTEPLYTDNAHKRARALPVAGCNRRSLTCAAVACCLLLAASVRAQETVSESHIISGDTVLREKVTGEQITGEKVTGEKIAAAHKPAGRNKYLTLKTNALYLGAGVSNIGIEYPLGKHFSIDLPFTYSPYTIRQDRRIRILALQPELRWWIKRPMERHFFGVHAHLAWFNIALDMENRYQSKSGRIPLHGFGLSYGYAIPIKNRWGIELTLGAGYARISYDTFHNTAGYQFSTDTEDYWGITRAGIAVIYKFRNKKIQNR